MTINEKLVKITSKGAIVNDLELGQDVELLVKGSVVKVENLDQQDGSYNIVFVVKLTSVEIK